MIEQLINNSIIVGEYTKNEKKLVDIQKTEIEKEKKNSWWYKSKNNKKY